MGTTRVTAPRYSSRLHTFLYGDSLNLGNFILKMTKSNKLNLAWPSWLLHTDVEAVPRRRRAGFPRGCRRGYTLTVIASLYFKVISHMGLIIDNLSVKKRSSTHEFTKFRFVRVFVLRIPNNKFKIVFSIPIYVFYSTPLSARWDLVAMRMRLR